MVSCKSSEGIPHVQKKINACFEGSNQIEVDEKVEFNEKTKILTFYIGISIKQSLKKWEIPLKELHSSDIQYINEDYPYLRIRFPERKMIKYYENGIENDSLNQFLYPLENYCFKDNEVKKLISNLKYETEKAQK
ncbi:hypothetical protein ASG21_12695 [Chryseobacterium sp. Leaf394]|nr:hypothetical protein ASG21_12695 [Chryseobacterium sp. Leaf394]